MRHIEFRVWNTSLKKYVPENFVHISPSGNLVFGATCGKPDYYKHVTDLMKGDNIVEQFTGLKDKNGVEIYEGDILIDNAGEPVEYWVVKFSYGGFVGECAGVAEPLFELTNLEVVGNIHETPELLEEK